MPPTRKLIALGAALAVAVTGVALAETVPGDHPMGLDHMQQHSMPSSQHPMGPGQMQEMMRQHPDMMPMGGDAGMTTPTLPGQDAFAAIQEIVQILDANPRPTGPRSIWKPCGSILST